MQTVEAIRSRMRSAVDLLTVVRTMKVLAAVNIRQYQKAAESLAEYTRTIELGLYVVLRGRVLPEAVETAGAPSRCGAVIWGSDQGLCGPLNRQVTTHALAHMEAAGLARADRRILAIGSRVLECCRNNGQVVTEHRSPPATEAGITPLVQDLMLLADDWHRRLGITRLYLHFCRTVPGAQPVPHTVQILPIDRGWLNELMARPWKSRSIPVPGADRDTLFSNLVREYLFAGFYRATAEALASENASRLAAMQRAQTNIEEHLEGLRRAYYSSRQAVITEELRDIVSGFEAMETGARRDRHGETSAASVEESHAIGVNWVREMLIREGGSKWPPTLS